MSKRGKASMLLLVSGGAIALALVPAASGKFRLWLSVSDSTPAVGKPITVVLGSAVDLDFNLKLIAVAPGKSVYNVVGVVTGESRLSRGRAFPETALRFRLFDSRQIAGSRG